MELLGTTVAGLRSAWAPSMVPAVLNLLRHLVVAIAELLLPRARLAAEAFRRRVSGLGVRELVTPPRSPMANAYCERVVGTLRRDCLDHLLVRDARQAERLLREYARYYDGRPHRGLRLQPPAGRHWPAPARPPPTISVRGLPILGGLHHRYGTALDGARLIG